MEAYAYIPRSPGFLQFAVGARNAAASGDVAPSSSRHTDSGQRRPPSSILRGFSEHPARPMAGDSRRNFLDFADSFSLSKQRFDLPGNRVCTIRFFVS